VTNVSAAGGRRACFFGDWLAAGAVAVQGERGLSLQQQRTAAAVQMSMCAMQACMHLLVGPKTLPECTRQPLVVHQPPRTWCYAMFPFVPICSCPPLLLSCVGEYLLNVLVVNKPTYKGLIIPG
jgi:hypothetical protein